MWWEQGESSPKEGRSGSPFQRRSQGLSGLSVGPGTEERTESEEEVWLRRLEFTQTPGWKRRERTHSKVELGLGDFMDMYTWDPEKGIPRVCEEGGSWTPAGSAWAARNNDSFTEQDRRSKDCLWIWVGLYILHSPLWLLILCITQLNRVMNSSKSPTMNLQVVSFQRCRCTFHQHQWWVKLQLALHILLLTILQLYHLSPPLPTSVSNSSCLFTRCQPLYVSYWTILLYFSGYCTVRLKRFLCLFFMYSVQSLSCVWLFETPRTAARQAALSITNSQSLLKLMFIESVMPSNHLILCHPLLLPSLYLTSGSFPMSEKILKTYYSTVLYSQLI